MKTKIFFILIFFASTTFCGSVVGQGIEDLVKNKYGGIYDKKITIERKPAILPSVREADILWSKTVWRVIDMREKMNQQFYFPTREIQGRSNLVGILLKGIKDNTILAFDAAQDDNEFVIPINYNQIRSTFGTEKQSKRNLETGVVTDSIVQSDIRIDEIKKLIVKEIWYFDKQKSTLQVRILGICPVRVSYRDDIEHNNKLFWVYYPDVRNILAKSESLNSRNGSRNFSFDDLFLIRNFDGYIVREENVYDNRNVIDYANYEYATKESDRIKNAIFNYEQDLWEY